jgi:hypothetical protein
LRKRLCLIAGPAVLVASLLVPVSAPVAAPTCATDVTYCPTARINSTGFSAHTTPRRDRRYPYTYTTSGRLGVPSSIGNARGCNGKVQVLYRVKKVAVSNRTAFLRVRGGRCVYSSRVTFRWVRRLVLLGGTPLRFSVHVRYLGDKYLKGRSHKPYNVIAG